MGCNCGSRRNGQRLEVTLPGQPAQRVASEAAAAKLTRGVKGATVRPVKEGSKP